MSRISCHSDRRAQRIAPPVHLMADPARGPALPTGGAQGPLRTGRAPYRQPSGQENASAEPTRYRRQLRCAIWFINSRNALGYARRARKFAEAGHDQRSIIFDLAMSAQRLQGSKCKDLQQTGIVVASTYRPRLLQSAVRQVYWQGNRVAVALLGSKSRPTQDASASTLAYHG